METYGRECASVGSLNLCVPEHQQTCFTTLCSAQLANVDVLEAMSRAGVTEATNEPLYIAVHKKFLVFSPTLLLHCCVYERDKGKRPVFGPVIKTMYNTYYEMPPLGNIYRLCPKPGCVARRRKLGCMA